MNAVQKYMPFLTSSLLMYVALFIIYPNYQYYIDPDGTAYLTIAKRYANGDYLKAINGYWSPWSCWLTAILIKCGMNAIPASVVINTIGATGFLYISQSFFLRFSIEKPLQWLLNLALTVFLCFAIFWQSFDDLWECFFLLTTLRLILTDGFGSRPFLWFLTGVLGTLAYFAKAYSFPFFILNTLVCIYFIVCKNKTQWLKVCGSAIATMIVLSLPWIYALRCKYGIWTTSTAGSLNMSWYLVGHPNWRESIKLLLPPAYPDSPYYWEDPWLVNGVTPHFWNSWHLLGLQFLRIGLNMWKLLRSSLELSVFFPVIGVLAISSLHSKKWKHVFTGDLKIIVYSFLLFPIGYVLINFESRYLWYMLPLSLVIGGVVLQQMKSQFKKLMMVLLAVSLIVFPVRKLKEMNHEGYYEFFMSEFFNAGTQPGSFVCRAAEGTQTQNAARFAYFTHNNYFNITDPKATDKDILAEMRRYHVKYYMSFDGSELKDEQGKLFKEIAASKADEVRVFVVNP